MLNHDQHSPTSSPPARVLVVDQSDDTRNVLRTVLERQGIEFLEALTASDGLKLLRQHRPNVVVLDLESDATESAKLQAEYGRELAAQQAQMVILGNLQHVETAKSVHRFLKPYHYRCLVQEIERLVQLNSCGNHPVPAPS